MTPETVLAVIDRVMSRPFEWRTCDCAMAARDVFQELWGIDLLAPWLGYSSRTDGVRLIRQGGGSLAMAEEMADRAGLRPGHKIGGVAISVAAPGRARSLLICIQPGLWAGKSKRGFAILRAADRGWHA